MERNGVDAPNIYGKNQNHIAGIVAPMTESELNVKSERTSPNTLG